MMNTVVHLKTYREQRAVGRAVETALIPFTFWFVAMGICAAAMAAPVALAAKVLLAQAEGVMAMGQAAADVRRDGGPRRG